MKLFSFIAISLLFLFGTTVQKKQSTEKQINVGLFGHSCVAYYSENINKELEIKGKVLSANDHSALIGANVTIQGTTTGVLTDLDGSFSIRTSEALPIILEVSYLGFKPEIVEVRSEKKELIIKLGQAEILEEVVVVGLAGQAKGVAIHAISAPSRNEQHQRISFHDNEYSHIDHNSEEYGNIVENNFQSPIENPLSTFSADIDRASYSNIRRFINDALIPPKDAVRIEEMINYFDYNYAEPSGNDPLAIHQTLTECPWNPEHQLLHIGLQAKSIPTDELPPSNLVFLIDVSGSMASQNKLPLVKSSLQNLVKTLRDTDKVAIVTYAGQAGVLLQSTPASDKQKILKAIASLGAGGSTAGAEGIVTAYEIAKENFLTSGNNRIILATDGDFNVGIRSPKALEQLIEDKRETGIFLSVLAYGRGNYKDEQMQTLADKGNGNHAYIDNLQEANKVLIHEFGGTLFTLAKDVKLQIEFNPAYVSNYRLIGYENRLLNPEDFNDDTKDAGEIGSGHTVTALYEIIPTGSKSSYVTSIDDLRYQKNTVKKSGDKNNELATIKFRYKEADGHKSKKLIDTISPKINQLKSTNQDVQFAIAVAEFGMLLRDSDFIHNGNYQQVKHIAQANRSTDKQGYRAEFIRLVEAMEGLDHRYVSE